MAHRHDVDRFNRWAGDYDQHWMQRVIFEPVQRTVLKLAAEQVPQPDAILDVGCGTGRLLGLAQSRFLGAKLFGVDAAIEMVRQAQTSHPDGAIRFQQAVAEELPFPDASFDLVFSTMTFHHWSDQGRGIAEVARVLRPGGRWLLAEFVASGFVGLIRRALRLHQFPEARRPAAPALGFRFAGGGRRASPGPSRANRCHGDRGPNLTRARNPLTPGNARPSRNLG